MCGTLTVPMRLTWFFPLLFDLLLRKARYTQPAPRDALPGMSIVAPFCDMLRIARLRLDIARDDLEERES